MGLVVVRIVIIIERLFVHELGNKEILYLYLLKGYYTYFLKPDENGFGMLDLGAGVFILVGLAR